MEELAEASSEPGIMPEGRPSGTPGAEAPRGTRALARVNLDGAADAAALGGGWKRTRWLLVMVVVVVVVVTRFATRRTAAALG